MPRLAKQLTLMDSLAASVRRLRLDKGMSQYELADACELDRSYVGEIERGYRNISILNVYRLARALDISGVQLIKMAEKHLNGASNPKVAVKSSAPSKTSKQKGSERLKKPR